MNGAEWLIFIVYDLVVARASLLALCVRGGGWGGYVPRTIYKLFGTIYKIFDLLRDICCVFATTHDGTCIEFDWFGVWFPIFTVK